MVSEARPRRDQDHRRLIAAEPPDIITFKEPPMAQPIQTNLALQKAMVIPKALLAFLSTAVFFSAFFLIGDVLIAAVSAIAVAVAQFILAQSSRSQSGLLVLASLAVVLALTGLSLAGDDPLSATNVTRVNATQSGCHCHTQDATNPAHLTPVPLREIPKNLAPVPGRV